LKKNKLEYRYGLSRSNTQRGNEEKGSPRPGSFSQHKIKKKNYVKNSRIMWAGENRRPTKGKKEMGKGAFIVQFWEKRTKKPNYNKRGGGELGRGKGG